MGGIYGVSNKSTGNPPTAAYYQGGEDAGATLPHHLLYNINTLSQIALFLRIGRKFLESEDMILLATKKSRATSYQSLVLGRIGCGCYLLLFTA